MIWIWPLPFIILAFAVFTNVRRKRRQFKYELTPNCLLTRWPVLFVTGKRSLFYFSNYWNVYPEFLTEHGYEVYTLHLPWSDEKQRQERLQNFLKEHSAQNRHYHLIVDTPTSKEFIPLWNQNFSCVESVNEMNSQMLITAKVPLTDQCSYALHRLKAGKEVTADPQSLGLSPQGSLLNAQILLQKIAQRAEEDFQAV